MTGCVAQRKDIYYVRLTYYDKDDFCPRKQDLYCLANAFHILAVSLKGNVMLAVP